MNLWTTISYAICQGGETIKITAGMRRARRWRWVFLAVVSLTLGAVLIPARAAAPLAPTGLLVDDVAGPVGTEAAPYFGWLDNDTNANEIQTGYEVLVASSVSNLAANLGDLWDSGEVLSGSENHVVYGGAPLTSDTEYYWKVRTWNREGNAGPYSTNSTFTVGLLANSDWSAASWIWRSSSASDDFTYYHKTAALPAGTVTRATVYVTSVQKYALYVNGTLVGKGPAYAFPQFQLYNAYDITALVMPGTTNLFAIFNHWFGGGSGRVADQRGVLMEAIVHYADGSSAVVGTDGTWLQSQATSWVTGQGSRGGSGSGYIEKIDARNLTPTWFTPGFNDSAWSTVSVFGPQPNSTFSGTPLPDLTRIVETVITPVSVTSLGGNNYLVDLGKLYSGVPSIQFSGGTSGTTVGMLGGFALLASGTIDPSQNQTLNLTYFTVLNGSTFTYQAAEYETMRYFEITNSPMVVTTNNFAFIQRNSQLNAAASSFSSPNTTLNAVWQLMKQTLPIDAQEEFIDSVRQKGGFLGDGFQESLAALQVMDERVLTRRRLNEFIESMGEFWNTGANIGRVNACYPDDNNARDIPDYTQAFLQWVWEYYMQSGDLAFLSTNYSALTNVALYVNASLNPADGLITRLWGGTSGSYTNGIIDWPPDMQFGYDLNTVRSPGNAATVINGWAWEDYYVMARMANELGNMADYNLYLGMANAIQAAINTNLINSAGVYIDGLEPDGTQSTHASQHANAFPLSLNLVPPAQQAGVIALVESLGMSVSALGILQLERALGEANQGPQLLNLYTNANQYGWAQILSFGGSATWESWTANTDGNSESHGWGAVGIDGYVRYIIGVEPLAAQFAQVQIKPLDFGNSLSTVSGSLLTDRGVISVEWDRNATQYHEAVTLPVNVTATVYLPQLGGTNLTVTLDGTNVTGVLTNGYVGIAGLGSGVHNLVRTIITTPVAGFSGGPTSGVAPLAVTFTNLSLNGTNFVWNFGDGNTLSTAANTNVSDIYAGAGSYTVSLTVMGTGGTNSLTNSAYIVVTPPPPPVAGFSGTPTTGVVPLTVTFSNLSSHATNYSWRFGDGNTLSTSAGTNVSNTYLNTGDYTVSLTAVGPGGTNTLTLPVYIQVANQPAINLHDGATTPVYSAAATTSEPVTVTAGATVLVALVEDHAVLNAEPTTLTWNGATLTRAVQEDLPDTTYRGSAIYYCYNPPTGSATLSVTVPGADATWLTAFTLGGTSTNVPLTGAVDSNAGGDTQLFTVAGVEAGAWAVLNSTWANVSGGNPLITGTGGTESHAYSSQSTPNTVVTAGYVAGLSAGTDTFLGTWAGTAQKMNFAGVVFAPSGSSQIDSWTAMTSSNWDASTANWTNAATAITYANGDGVLFNDAAARFAVNLATNVLPSGVTFNNSANNYIIGSAGGYSITGGGTLTLAGSGTVTLDNLNTYSNATLILNGTLLVNGTLSNSPVIVGGGTLGGSGTIGGPVTVQAGGVLAPGAGGTAAGTVLTLGSGLTLNSGSLTTLAVSHGRHTNDQVAGVAVAYAGTLIVATNAGDGPFAAGDVFRLFKANSYSGSFSMINLPALNPGLGWTNTLAANGSLSVVLTTSLAPVHLAATLSGTMLLLSWPADHTGWRLVAQTNHLAGGLSANTNDWTTVSGSATVDSENITIDPTMPVEFYELVYP